MQCISYYNFMHFLSTSVQNYVLLTQLPYGCFAFQVILFLASLHLFNVYVEYKLNSIQHYVL